MKKRGVVKAEFNSQLVEKPAEAAAFDRREAVDFDCVRAVGRAVPRCTQGRGALAPKKMHHYGRSDTSGSVVPTATLENASSGRSNICAL